MPTDLKKMPGSASLSSIGSDLDLARAAAAGDTAARRAIAEGLYDDVRETVRYLSADHRDQDDWVHLTLLEILRSVGTYRGDGPLKKWANRIAARTVIRLAKRARFKESTVGLESASPAGLEAASDESQSRILVRRHLARLLKTLTPEQRSVVVLRLVYEYGIDEIAKITHSRPNTVRARLTRGRKRLKARIAQDSVFDDWIQARKK